METSHVKPSYSHVTITSHFVESCHDSHHNFLFSSIVSQVVCFFHFALHFDVTTQMVCIHHTSHVHTHTCHISCEFKNVIFPCKIHTIRVDVDDIQKNAREYVIYNFTFSVKHASMHVSQLFKYFAWRIVKQGKSFIVHRKIKCQANGKLSKHSFRQGMSNISNKLFNLFTIGSISLIDDILWMWYGEARV